MKHRSSQALFAHWDDKRGDRALPERNVIDPAVLRGALGDTFILAYNSVRGHVFRLAGTRVCALAGREVKDHSFLSLWHRSDRQRVAEMARSAVDDAVGVVAAVHAATADRQALDLELLLLPLNHCGQSHLRMIGSLAPLAVPYWLGASPIGPLTLGSHRYLGHRLAPPAFAPPLTLPPTMRVRRGFVVYDGGRA